MIGLLTGLSFQVKAVLVGVAAIAAIGLIFKVRSDWINQGRLAGRQDVVQELEARYGLEWERRLEAMDDRALELAAKEEAQHQERQDLATQRARLAGEIRSGFVRIQAEMEGHGRVVSAVADSDLAGAIRSVLFRLDAADPDGAAQNPFLPAGAGNQP